MFIPHFTFASFQSIEINEINYTGYTVWVDDNATDASDEFIELKNSNPSTPMVLDGWTMRILSGSGSTSDRTINLSGTITDYVVVRKISATQSGLTPLDNILNTTNFGSLNNTTGAYIELRNNLGITIDAVNFRNKWPLTTNNTQSLHKVNNLVWEVKPHSPLNIISNPTPIPIPSPTPTPTPTLDPEKIVYSGVIISEIYPNPAVSGEEFVELYNTTDKDIDLQNWKLDDIPNGGSTIQTLTGIIPAKGFMILESGAALKIGLNNDQDSVILYDPDGKIQSQVDY
ncbi:MAG: lamin tail domain-containing protein, partial [Candidatus Paceibacterota bacterium]